MRLDEVLARLYDAEINCSVSSFFDMGWRVRLGDSTNGYTAEGWGETPQEVAETLWSVAQIQHPVLEFEDWVREGCEFRGMSESRLDRLVDGSEKFAAILREQARLRRTPVVVTEEDLTSAVDEQGENDA